MPDDQLLLIRNYTNKSETKIIGLEPCYSISVSETTRYGKPLRANEAAS